MMLGIGLSTRTVSAPIVRGVLPTLPQWEDVMGELLLAALAVQAACLFVVLPWLLVSKRRLRLRAADLPTVSEAGWVPFRDPRLLVGSLSIVLAVLVQSVWFAAAWSTNGMAWLVAGMAMVVLIPGVLAVTATLQMVALSFVRTAWDANEWPQKLSLRERPALTLVRILRYSPCACFAIGVILFFSTGF